MSNATNIHRRHGAVDGWDSSTGMGVDLKGCYLYSFCDYADHLVKKSMLGLGRTAGRLVLTNAELNPYGNATLVGLEEHAKDLKGEELCYC